MTRRSRLTSGVAAVAGLLALVASARPDPEPWFLWNTTASAPLGLYQLKPTGPLQVGRWVAVRPPSALAHALDARGALPLGVPLLKRIAALSPSVVCRAGAVVTIDGHLAAMARALDRHGRVLPTWSGCTRLGAGAVFLVNNAPGSLDSRYFGALPVTAIIGEAQPILRFGSRP